jgi:hypothetical protein
MAAAKRSQVLVLACPSRKLYSTALCGVVYGPAALVNAPFVLSLRHVGYTGVIMLAVNANVSEEDLAFMERLEVSLSSAAYCCVRDIISQQALQRGRASAASKGTRRSCILCATCLLLTALPCSPFQDCHSHA